MKPCPLCGGRFVGLSALAFYKCSECGFALSDSETLPDLDAMDEPKLARYLLTHHARMTYLAEHASGVVRAVATDYLLNAQNR